MLIAADSGERAALESVLRELMQRLSVDVEVEAVERIERAAVLAPVPAGAPYLARCFLDLRADGHALLYVHDPVRDRVLEREVSRAPGSEELAREELGHMLLASIEALLSGATVGAPRSELAAAATPAPPPPPSTPAAEPPLLDRSEPARAGWLLRGAVLYELAALGHGPGITHGPLLAALARAPFADPGVGLLLSAQYRFPFDADADPIGMRVHAFALRALLTLDQALSARVGLRIGVGAGADVTRIAPQSAASGNVALADTRTLALGVTRGLLGVDIRLSRGLSLWAALAADVDLERNEYVLVQRDGHDAELLAPWRVRPAVSLGVVLP